MQRNKTATTHDFSTVPRADIQRSVFPIPQTRKQSFDASELIPILCEPILPGDVWEHRETINLRLATPIAPLQDDLDFETFYFMVPNRLTWPDWEDFITGVNTSLVIPKIYPKNAADATYNLHAGGAFDHFGLLPQTYSSGQFGVNALPIFAYFQIFNKWFRDQNLQEEWIWSDTWTIGDSDEITNDGVEWDQECLRINKRHDQFTASLPWPQKGAAVSIPLGSTAPVISNGTPPQFWDNVSALEVANLQVGAGATAINQTAAATGAHQLYFYQSATGLQTDLSAATSATINALRLAMVTQQMLELDARGGSRYVENLMTHWGVRSPDYRLQNPEYIGGSKIPIVINPVAQTAAYDAEPGPVDSAVGNLGAEMHGSSSKRTFRYAATEHGYIIGVGALRSTPTYQQGTRMHWRQVTRLDFYEPVLANIGEQAVDTQEIYQPTNNTPANATWGYQEAWWQYRMSPNEITGKLRSTYSAPMDWWHLSEEFGTEPALNASFITDKTQETLARALATAPNAQWADQAIMDIRHDSRVARLMPAYSVPGLRRF